MKITLPDLCAAIEQFNKMSDEKLEQMKLRGSIKSIGCGILYIVDHGWATVAVYPYDFPDGEALLTAAKQIDFIKRHHLRQQFLAEDA